MGFRSLLMIWFRLHIFARNSAQVRLCSSHCQDPSQTFMRVSWISRVQHSRTVEWQCERAGRQDAENEYSMAIAQGSGGCQGHVFNCFSRRHPPQSVQPLWFLWAPHDHFLQNQLSFSTLRAKSPPKMTSSLSFFGGSISIGSPVDMSSRRQQGRAGLHGVHSSHPMPTPILSHGAFTQDPVCPGTCTDHFVSSFMSELCLFTEQDSQVLPLCLQSLFFPGIRLHFFSRDLILLPSAVSPTFPLYFPFSKVLKWFSNFELFEFHQMLIPTFPMSRLRLAHTMARSPMREESGMLNADPPSICHSSFQR